MKKSSRPKMPGVSGRFRVNCSNSCFFMIDWPVGRKVIFVRIIMTDDQQHGPVSRLGLALSLPSREENERSGQEIDGDGGPSIQFLREVAVYGLGHSLLTGAPTAGKRGSVVWRASASADRLAVRSGQERESRSVLLLRNDVMRVKGFLLIPAETGRQRELPISRAGLPCRVSYCSRMISAASGIVVVQMGHSGRSPAIIELFPGPESVSAHRCRGMIDLVPDFQQFLQGDFIFFRIFQIFTVQLLEKG